MSLQQLIYKPLTNTTDLQIGECGETVPDSQLAPPLWKTQMFLCHKATRSFLSTETPE